MTDTRESSQDGGAFQSSRIGGMDRGVGRVREEMADARLMAASFCASDASFCISEVFSEASSTLDVGGAAQLSDVVRRGGSGAC